MYDIELLKYRQGLQSIKEHNYQEIVTLTVPFESSEANFRIFFAKLKENVDGLLL